MRTPTGLVLAAGAGARLGRGPKALLPFAGATLVEHIAGELLAGGCGSVVAVLGAGADRAAAALSALAGRVRPVVNPAWATGMASSLRVGLATIGSGRDVLVTPVDRPGLCAAEVRRVLDTHEPGGITAAAHRGATGQLRRGHPVLFAARWTAAAAEAAHDDVGARPLLAAERELVRLVDCSDLEDGGDVDAPADLARLGDAPEPIRTGRPPDPPAGAAGRFPG